MTDTEIKNILHALNICTNKEVCDNCPYLKIADTMNGYCVDMLQKSCLQLITEQQVENAIQNLDHITKELETAKRENKILSKNADTAFQDGLNEARDLYKKEVADEIKSEVYIEFAERFKEIYEDDVTDSVIDNLLAEMEGKNERNTLQRQGDKS